MPLMSMLARVRKRPSRGTATMTARYELPAWSHRMSRMAAARR